MPFKSIERSNLANNQTLQLFFNETLRLPYSRMGPTNHAAKGCKCNVVDMDLRGSLIISLFVLHSQSKQNFQGIHV